MMLKRLFLALILMASPAYAAGTIPGISMTQQFGRDAKPLIGGKLTLIQAGTTSTLQNCYQDTGLTIAWPNPITLDSAGRVPQLFCADGSIKIRLTNSAGVQQLVADNLLVVGPSGGGGGGGSVDPTTVLTTGDFKAQYNTGSISGFVRCNGRTIGSGTSGATERANSDVQALFVFLWGVDSNLSVSTGRGASAAADWSANKTLTLPDCRGRALAGLDDMGNSAASRLTATYWGATSGATGIVLGGVGGGQSAALMSTGQLPPYTPAGTISNGAITVTYGNVNIGSVAGGGNSIVVGGNSGSVALSTYVTAAAASQATSTFTGSAVGSSTPFATVSPSIVMTIYIKL